MNCVKIGLYARVSSEKQAQERTIESQVATILDYVESKQGKIEPELYFIDDGFSGSSLERPGLDRLRDKALAGQVSKVYVLAPDRLSRKSAHQILLIEEMKRLGVDFAFVNRDIGDTPEDQMLLQIQGIVAEYEREKILERSRRGKLYAAKKGKINVLGGAPYGYYYKKATETEDASYIIHLNESIVVKEAYNLYCNEGKSIGQVAKEFTKKGYPTRTGKTFWERSVIWAMLRNPAYMGKAAFRKTKRVRRIKKTKLAIESKHPLRSEFSSPRDRPKEEWIYISVPAIIDEKTFEYAQMRLQSNIKLSPRNNKKYNYLLSGLLRCKTCGYSIYGKPASTSKYKRLYYRCMGQDGYRWPQGRVCKGHPVRTEAIDELVWESVKGLVLEPQALIEEYQNRLGRPSQEPIIDSKLIDLRRLRAERSRLIDLFESGLVEKDEIESKLKNNRAKIEQIENEISYLKKEKREREQVLTVIRNLKDFSAKIKENLDGLDFKTRKQIVRLLVEEVEVDTIKEEINVKHIIPLDARKCQLCSGTRNSALWRTALCHMKCFSFHITCF